MNFGILHKIVPFFMQILGVYIILLGILSVVFGIRLENLSFLQFHFGRTASIFTGMFMVMIGNGLRARTRISWYMAIGLILTSLISMFIRGFSLAHLDIIGAAGNIFILYILIKYRKEYAFPWINLSIEGKVALSAILISVIYGVGGTLLLGDQFEPPVKDFYTAVYYSFVVLTTLGIGDILPVTITARLFTVSVAMLGIASFLGALSTFVGPVLQQRMNKVVNVMESMEFSGFSDHSIVCGYTPLCSEFLKSLRSMNVPIVVMVRDIEISMALKNEGYIVFREHPDDIEELQKAGLRKARHVFICSGDDGYNLLIALTVQRFKKQEHLNYKVTAFVNSSRNSELMDDFCDEIIDIARVLNDYMFRSVSK